MDPTRSAKGHREPRSSRSIENSRNNEPVISLFLREIRNADNIDETKGRNGAALLNAFAS